MGFENFLNLSTTTLSEVFLKVALAAIFGFILGYDRAKHDKPLGYRVYMIVCIITCLMAVMGLEMHTNLQGGDHATIVLDLGKIISGILTGVGFIGAGAIMRQDDQVIGTTTGSCIWAAGGLGLLLGFGFYSLAVIGFLIIAFVLILLNRFLGLFLKKQNLDKH